MDQFFFNHYALGVIAGITAVVVFLVTAVVTGASVFDGYERWEREGWYRRLGTSLAIMTLTGALALSALPNGFAGEEDQSEREAQTQIEQYSEKLSEQCDAATVSRFRQVAPDYQGARDQRSGPEGAYQDILIQGCTTKGM